MRLLPVVALLEFVGCVNVELYTKDKETLRKERDPQIRALTELFESGDCSGAAMSGSNSVDGLVKISKTEACVFSWVPSANDSTTEAAAVYSCQTPLLGWCSDDRNCSPRGWMVEKATEKYNPMAGVDYLQEAAKITHEEAEDFFSFYQIACGSALDKSTQAYFFPYGIAMKVLDEF